LSPALDYAPFSWDTGGKGPTKFTLLLIYWWFLCNHRFLFFGICVQSYVSQALEPLNLCWPNISLDLHLRWLHFLKFYQIGWPLISWSNFVWVNKHWYKTDCCRYSFIYHCDFSSLAGNLICQTMKCHWKSLFPM